MSKIKTFKYTDAKGKETQRTAFCISPASDKNFMIDLSEFEGTEREHYIAILEDIDRQYLTAIKEAGLGSNFRYFKQSKIAPITGE